MGSIDTYDWSICSSECVPRNRAVDVDPEEFPEGIIVAFSDPVSEAEVLSTQPEFSFTANLIEKRMKLEIKFVDYTMPYETEFRIRIHVDGPAGFPKELKYSFTTKAKE
jgi:hypothetical protein